MIADEVREGANEPHRRIAHWMRLRMPRSLPAIGREIFGAAITTVTLSIGFMVFNDYIAPPPDLAGRWKFTVVYEDTAYEPFRGLKVTYQALLIQEGLELVGTGEKLSDLEPQGSRVEYTNDKRTNIEVTGNITRNYFSPDTLVIHYNEEGRRRESSTLHQLVYFDEQTMCGCFESTIADTFGSVWWERIEDRDSFYAPVSRPAVCSADCQAPRLEGL